MNLTSNNERNPETDMQLLARMREQHDPLAFRILYERYWEKLYVIAYRKLRSNAVAADLVQEIFVRLWEKRATLDISKSLEGYLFISLRNSIFNHFKNSILRLRHLHQFSAQATTQENSTEALSAYRELYGHLAREVEMLPEKMREVFLLSRQYHLSTKEISHKLSISEQTVRNQVSDALRRLRLGIREK